MLQRNVRTLFERPEGTIFALDGLRALSVLWVIAYHTWKRVGGARVHAAYEPLFRIANRGLLGVDVFFVLSGFLIGTMLLREVESTGRIAYGRFYVRRALRILPVYWVTLGIYCLLDGENAANAWANVCFVNNLLPESQQAMKWTWSLAIEEQFYLGFPLVLALASSRASRLRVLVALFFFGIAVRGWLVWRYALHVPGPDHARLYYDVVYDKPYARFGELLTGAIAASLARSTDAVARVRSARRGGPVATIAAALVIGGLATIEQPIFRYDPPPAAAFLFYTLSHVVFSAAVAWLILACVARAPGAKTLDLVLSWRAFRPVAVLSYSAYLVHVMVIDLGPFGRAETLGAMLVALVLVPLATLATASPFYLFVERPLMNARDRQKQS